MKNLFIYTVLATGLLLTFAVLYGHCDDDERHGEPHRYLGGSYEGYAEEHHSNAKIHLNPVINQTYKEACGACHMTYQPELLPSGSWGKILNNVKDHFGEPVEVDAASKGVIEKYLLDNAAERSQGKLSLKIVRSLRGETPLRITEIRYIRSKHREIRPEVFKRKTVSSLSNCSACHRTADQGIYEDDNVRIPK
jgi:hypothetical protein